jgi:rod shape-determining protein MreD
MWKKLFFITLLCYFSVLLQNSFFSHFNFFGAVPNILFIIFFLLVFFSKNCVCSSDGKDYEIVFWAIIAGFFLDVFSFVYIGPSILIFLIMGFLIKKIQLSLKSRQDNYPFVYFFPLFAISFIVYNLLINLVFFILYPKDFALIFNFGIIISAIYNSALASLAFYIVKKTILYVKRL